MIYMFYTDIAKNSNWLREHGSNYLSKDESERIKECINPIKSLQIIASSLLRRTALSKITGGSAGDINLNKNPNGKPYLEGNNLYFSSSNTRQYAICAISDKGSIGVDLEDILNRQIDKSYSFFHKDELSEIKTGHFKTEYFWSRKEAYIKCIGTGWFEINAAELSTVPDMIEVAGTNYFLKSKIFHENFILSICTLDKTYGWEEFCEISREDMESK